MMIAENKKLIILVGKDGRPSMRSVYSKLTSNAELWVRRRLVGRRTGRIREWFRKYTGWNSNAFTKVKINESDFTNKIIIRWGNRIEIDTTNSIVYNTASAIAKATDKKESRRILAEDNISVPRAVTPQCNNINYPVIARPRIHAKGRNFIVLRDVNQFYNHWIVNQEDWYYSEFVDKVAEYRVHVGSGRVLNMLEKPNPGNGQIAWNRAVNGEAFNNIRWNDYDGPVAYEAVRAVNALKLTFAGVDVIVDREGKPYVLELNASPTLNSSEYSMSRYAKYFDWLAKTNEKRENWPLKEFKNPSNYAWHEYHFEDREPNNN